MNIYYHPEKFGLTPVGEIDRSDRCYCYDTLVVWKKQDGTIVYDRDSGCSCPCPFENSSLETVSTATDRQSFRDVLVDFLKDSRGDGPNEMNTLLDAAFPQ